jgi:3-deoxy-D-manno-octulosonic acid kinase
MALITEQLSPNHWLCYDLEWVEKPNTSIFTAVYWQQQERIFGSATGRGTTWFVQMPKIQAALRHYRRGGLFGRLVQDSYLYTGLKRTRSFAELALLQELRRAGVRVPRPLAAQVERKGLCYRADILTEYIEGATSLLDLLKQRALTDAECASVALEIAKMHKACVNHTDLNIHNILLDKEGLVWLIDFDKCYKSSAKGWRQANLKRLERSFLKESKKQPLFWQPKNFTQFLSYYDQYLSC